MTYPGRGADIETTPTPSIPGNGDAEDSHEIYERPYDSDGRIQKPVGRLPVPHNDEVRVDGDGAGEAARGQVASRDEPALGPADRDAHGDAVDPHPFRAQHEGRRLVHVGEQQVEDENEELIRRLLDRQRALFLLQRLRPHLLLHMRFLLLPQSLPHVFATARQPGLPAAEVFLCQPERQVVRRCGLLLLGPPTGRRRAL